MFVEWINDNIASISLAAIISGSGGFFISLYTLILSRRKVVTSAITSNRIEWISKVRELMYDFIEAYINDEDSEEKRLKKIHIELYIRDAECYRTLIDILNLCANNQYEEEVYESLILACQDTLHDVWLRMKREAGISKRSDYKISKEFKI